MLGGATGATSRSGAVCGLYVDNDGINRADALANAGRESNTLIETDEEDGLDNHPALHDGARLRALEAKHMYDIPLRRNTKDVPPILHQEKLDDAKHWVQQTMGLHATNEKYLNSIKSLKVPPRLRII